MLAAGVIDGVEAGDRAADASHPECEKHADRLRRPAHHGVDRIVKSNEIGRLRHDATVTPMARPCLCGRKLHARSGASFYANRFPPRVKPEGMPRLKTL
jgi:hypothetical protein